MQFVQFVAARADTGAVLPYAQATVYLAGTSTLASLFDADGAPIENPAPGLGTGEVGLAASDGAYDIQITSADGTYSLPLIKKVQIADLSGIIGTITSGRISRQTWAELATITGTAEQLADVPSTDTGTHTDPVVGGVVDNSGVFRWSASPAGWERLYDSMDKQVQDGATRSQAWAESDTPPDPDDPDSKSAKGWAQTVPQYAQRADAERQQDA